MNDKEIDEFRKEVSFLDLQQMRDELVKVRCEALKNLFTCDALLKDIRARKDVLFLSGKLDDIEESCYKKEFGGVKVVDEKGVGNDF